MEIGIDHLLSRDPFYTKGAHGDGPPRLVGHSASANRDFERAYESVLRIGTTCETVQIWTACELTDRDDERYGADLDGVRTATRSRRGAEVVRSRRPVV